MFNPSVLNVITGLVFIYLLYSLLATMIQEIIATNFNFRAKILERAVFRMLEDENGFKSRFKSVFYLFKKQGNGGKPNSTTAAFYNHPLIKFLGEDEHHSKPAYIKKETFSKVMIDLLRGNNLKPEDDVTPIIQHSLDAKKTSWGDAKISAETLSYLNSIWVDAQGDLEKFRENLENWFDLTMDRASEWYKRHVQVILFFIGFAIAIVFNVDTIIIVDKLEKDPKLRDQLVQQADVFVKSYPNLDEQILRQKSEIENFRVQNTGQGLVLADSIRDKQANLDKYMKIQAVRDKLIQRTDSLITIDIKNANDVVGLGLNSYDETFTSWKCFLKSLAGWILTALALSLGAPFWFDLLNKLMKLRSAVNGSPSDKKQKTPNTKA